MKGKVKGWEGVVQRGERCSGGGGDDRRKEREKRRGEKIREKMRVVRQIKEDIGYTVYSGNPQCGQLWSINKVSTFKGVHIEGSTLYKYMHIRETTNK